MWIMRRRGGLTAKKLARLCGCRCKKFRLPRRYPHFLINYGNNVRSANLNANVDFDKYKQLRTLRVGDVSVPNYYGKYDNIPDNAFPLLARKKYHSQGRDITYIANRQALRNLPSWKYDFLTEYINKKSEYRVHILGNDIVMVSVKWSENPNADPIVRAKRFGWKQIEYDGEYKEELADIARQAIEVLGWDFGAVDIIRKKDRFWVLEVNSSAGLEERKLQVYADWFKQKEREWLRRR
jgi:hypothetical protein